MRMKKYNVGGQNKQNIYISVDRAKDLCMMRRKNTVAISVREYFRLMEKLVKDYLRNPDTSVLSFLREEIKSREHDLLERYSQQIR
jgi:phage anti-repressor protein